MKGIFFLSKNDLVVDATTRDLKKEFFPKKFIFEGPLFISNNKT